MFCAVNILLAFIDSVKIKKGATVNHFANAIIYVLIAAPAIIYIRNYWLLVTLLFLRLVLFNISLSLLRGYKWDYISPSPKSVVDRAAKYIFGDNAVFMYAVYLSILVLSIIMSLR